MCYIGKATKIFIFLITVLVITGLILGFGLLRRTIHPKSQKCSGESCSQSDSYLPPPPPLDFPISSIPDPSDLTSPPPSGSNSNLAPPPASPSLTSPPPESSSNQTPPPLLPVTPPPPPPLVIVAPPPVTPGTV